MPARQAGLLPTPTSRASLAKLAPLASLSAALAILLSACGGGGGGAGSTAIAPTAPTTPTIPTAPTTPGEYADTVVYSGAASASLPSASENAAVIAAHIQLAGKEFDYTVTSGHLTASDVKTGKPTASFFYVAYTAGGSAATDLAKRPVT